MAGGISMTIEIGSGGAGGSFPRGDTRHFVRGIIGGGNMGGAGGNLVGEVVLAQGATGGGSAGGQMSWPQFG